MIVQYGSFAFADNEAMVTFWGRRTDFDRRGRERIRRNTMVIEGEIVADGAAAIDTRIGQIKDAFSLGGSSASLLIPPSTGTHIALDNATSLSGVKIRSMHVPQRDGEAAYATGLRFGIILEADYLLSPGDDLIDYTETITRVGSGGPRTMLIDVVEGDLVRQYTTEQTAITLIQSGFAVGILGYPEPNPALIPSLVEQPEGEQITPDTPRCENGIYVEWPIRWQYRMTVNSTEYAASGLPTNPTPAIRDNS